ncbi:MAG: M1 family aminopeptidase/hydrolase, partial [Acidobacteria bacterium]|nr:M1 family aminopeptidase/hydrolase [Acidobacteriota bacterium]
MPKNSPAVRDIHSYATPETIRVKHLELNVTVDFDRRVSVGQNIFTPLTWKLGATDPVLGTPLSVEVPIDVERIRIRYETSPDASALQWLEPAQTAGKKHPFLFTQAQAIHARSFVPCQDSPAVRITFAARIRTPQDLVAVMGADMGPSHERNGDYRFRMPEPIPSYLIALAVGDLEFHALGRRTGVYAEPSVVDRAAKEFEDLEKMIGAAERLFGPYRWERYDVLVMPPSFPFGGMENPRLTFVTPTILAGDKSLVSLIAHELA